MNITISIFTIVATIVIVFLAGFWLGRSIRWMMQDTESRLEEPGETEKEESISVRNGRRDGKGISMGWAIGSPVTGEVRSFCEGSRRGALIRSEQGKLYAPASGKITRLYPMGNAMLLRTDFGVEIMMRVGDVKDELCSSCFRSYVIQNEVIHKGKLLLEFDMEGLRKEGVDPSVSVTVETVGDYRDITLSQSERVKSGEELLWVRDVSGAADAF